MSIAGQEMGILLEGFRSRDSQRSMGAGYLNAVYLRASIARPFASRWKSGGYCQQHRL